MKPDRLEHFTQTEHGLVVVCPGETDIDLCNAGKICAKCGLTLDHDSEDERCPEDDQINVSGSMWMR